MANKTAIIICLASTSLTGCVVGPDYSPPKAPGLTAYIPADTSARLTQGKSTPAQRLVDSGTLSTAWWQMFRYPSLDKVVRDSIAGNPILDAAKATLAQAHEAVLQARGGYYPQLDFGGSASYQRGPAFALGLLHGQELPTYSIFSLGPTVSYSPDVFGLTTRQVEKQEALAENQADQLAAAQLTITGNAVIRAIDIAEERQQIVIIKAILTDDEQNLALVREQYASGKITRSDVLAVETQESDDQALLAPLEQNLNVAQDALAILTGRSPAQWTPPAFDLNSFSLPPTLPLSLPSTLVERRPDIRAAQAQLHAASAAIGVATAQMYPSFPLSASVSTTSLAAVQLFQGSSLVWSLAGGISAPIFHGGALKAQRRGAIDGFRASLALYRQTVLAAFAQVADTMRAIDHDALLAQSRQHSVNQASQSLELQRLRNQAGKIDALALHQATRAAEQARLGDVAARAQRLRDSALMLVAMGGGWQSAPADCDACQAPMPKGMNP